MSKLDSMERLRGRLEKARLFLSMARERRASTAVRSASLLEQREFEPPVLFGFSSLKKRPSPAVVGDFASGSSGE